MKISTTQFKYGGSSLYWEGGERSTENSKWLQLNDKTNIKDIWEDQTVDYTIEFWIYPLRFGSFDSNSIIDIAGLTDIGGQIEIFNNKIRLFAYDNGSISSNTAIVLYTWQHVALVRKQGIWSLFLNGILDNVKTLTDVSTGPWSAFIGRSVSTLESHFYLDSLRLTKGYALYTSNFNPNTQTSLIY